VLPPVLEIYALWHPDDPVGEELAQELIDHFHGTAFSGLIGGAVEIYVRSAPWREPGGPPRPMPFQEPLPYGLPSAELTVVVPFLGLGMASVVEAGDEGWTGYLQTLLAARSAEPYEIGVFPFVIDPAAVDGTALGELFVDIQRIGHPDDLAPADQAPRQRCRDLAQAIAQLADGPGDEVLTVFISHTKKATGEEGESHVLRIDRVRRAIQHTHLREYFDASDLQPGVDWAEELRAKSATSALLGVRTDLYATREWCQREVSVAKRAGMPVVMIDALQGGEERGSFLMDHVPRVAGHPEADGISEAAILEALGVLVDECLKRELWRRQLALSGDEDLEVAWWAPHAPEPLTFVDWIHQARSEEELPAGKLRILHPDPPLGPDELAALVEIASIAGLEDGIEVLTPRGLAARGG